MARSRKCVKSVIVACWAALAVELLGSCRRELPVVPDAESAAPETTLFIEVPYRVTLDGYFGFMDSLVAVYQPQLPYAVSEHLLVHANRWVLDTLAATDYYRRMARDSFVYDQRQQVALPAGSRLLVPDAALASQLQQRLEALWLDINIPEFKLRIYQDSTELYCFHVRVGQNRTRFLEMSGRETDLRTQPGTGRIIRHERNPLFYNPVDGTRYYSTRRDDGRRTLMPRIPWLETEIDGRRNGQLIHPTTNPETLGRAYSNGCIGTAEAAAWILYYHAPLGTPVRIRYQLHIVDSVAGNTRLKDIYGWEKDSAATQPAEALPAQNED